MVLRFGDICYLMMLRARGLINRLMSRPGLPSVLNTAYWYWILNIEHSISISIRHVQYWKILNIEREYIKVYKIASFMASAVISIKKIYYIICSKA